MSYTANGWTVRKKRVSYYAFGDETKVSSVNDIVCDDGIMLLINELEKIQAGLSSSASKNNALLQRAAEFFACSLIVKSGNATQKSGNITSESLEGMSVSYESLGQRKITDATQPQDWYGMAIDMIKRYAEANLSANRGIGLSIRTYRNKIFNGSYDKYRDTNEW